ncbi:hypothetical protein [Pedobacter sp. Leaf176]|uniref:hypothetical protein n=1 Tax=Pedobacter sp. Leaf176 TaxID=1736286 RepID=UPI0006F503D6|nr:hypothetical protein [Pedobacter sp. Leaf176]KQR71452.1 hypothetical protein ASF92_08760 [Pedobacter sp. Leaf176]
MKFLIALLFCCSVSFYASAQKRWKYKIKVVEHQGKRHRGFFYAAEDNQLTLIKSNGDTIRLETEQIEKLYIHRRGIVAPVAIATAIAAAAFAIDNPNALETAVIIVVGIPIGFCVGLVAGELFANKRFYKKLNVNDFPLIKSDLRRYTEVK